jgi:hypothetical protein
MMTHGVVVDRDTAEKVIASGDCVAITLLLEMNTFNEIIIEFANNIVLTSDDYGKDNNWFLLYQLYYKGLIADPYNDGVFECLKEYSVNFIPHSTKSNAEIRCEEIQQEMASEALRHIFTAVEPANTDSEEQSNEDAPVF